MNLNNRQYIHQDSFCNMGRNRYMCRLALCNHLDKFHFYRFSTVFRQWTRNGPRVDRKWTGNGTEMDRKWNRNGPEMKWKWTKIKPKWLFTIANYETFRMRKFQVMVNFIKICLREFWPPGFNTTQLNLSLDILAGICSQLYNKY